MTMGLDMRLALGKPVLDFVAVTARVGWHRQFSALLGHSCRPPGLNGLAYAAPRLICCVVASDLLSSARRQYVFLAGINRAKLLAHEVRRALRLLVSPENSAATGEKRRAQRHGEQ